MVSPVLLRKLVRDLGRHKIAILALVLIVAIGVGGYVGMAALWLDMDGARQRYYTRMRLADFWVDLKRAPQWTVEHVAALPNVRAVRGRVHMQVLVDLPGQIEPVSGTAISLPVDRRPVLNDALLQRGTWFSGQDDQEVILNEQFAHENGLRPGHRLRVTLLDKQHELLVVGTAMSPEFIYLIPAGGGLAPDPKRFGVMYLPEKFLQDSCDLAGAYNQLVGVAHDNSRAALDRTLERIERELDRFGVTNTTPVQEQMSPRFLADELQGLKVSAKVVPAIFLGVAVLVLNILLGRMAVQQRTIIGTLKALGYSSTAVLRHYVGYGVIVGVAGAVAGLGFGAWVQVTMIGLYRQFFAMPGITPHFYPDVILFGVLISVGAAALGTLKGVRLAARLQPAEAMRPPPPEKGGKVLPEYVPALWTRLPFRWKMILRAVFRNPFRSGVSILACTISTALILSMLSQMDSLDYLMSYEFERVSHQDVTVGLRDPKGVRSESEFQDLPTVTETEPELTVVCDIKYGPYEKRIGVIGLTRGHRLRTPLDASGRPIIAPDSGLVFSRKLAQILQVQPGDTVQLRPLIARRTETEAPVVGIVDSFLGLSAYADVHYLSRLLGEEWVANMLLGNTRPKAQEGPFLEALKERPAVVGISERKRSLTQMQATFGETMGTSISVMVLLAGVVAFGSVLNAAIVSLSERQREVGTLRVLGYTPAQVGLIFSGESLLLNAVGVGLGLWTGVGLAHLLALAYDTELYRFPAIIYPSRLLISAALMFVFVGAAQLLIHRMIRRLPWLDVLKVKE